MSREITVQLILLMLPKDLILPLEEASSSLRTKLNVSNTSCSRDVFNTQSVGSINPLSISERSGAFRDQSCSISSIGSRPVQRSTRVRPDQTGAPEGRTTYHLTHSGGLSTFTEVLCLTSFVCHYLLLCFSERSFVLLPVNQANTSKPQHDINEDVSTRTLPQI